MKSVIKSLRPDVCMRIANGEQSIIVAKSAPKEVPFKVYIYETKAQFVKSANGACTKYGYGRGKVIGEFVCDKVEKITPSVEWGSHGYDTVDDDLLKEMCLERGYLEKYGAGVTLYGWHITAPTLFDKPKELGEFRKVCLNGKCSDCIYEECKITRPPQSWCYVEELQ